MVEPIALSLLKFLFLTLTPFSDHASFRGLISKTSSPDREFILKSLNT